MFSLRLFWTTTDLGNNDFMVEYKKYFTPHRWIRFLSFAHITYMCYTS